MSTLTLTTIQTQLHWEDKAANLAMLEEKINAIGQKTEVVLLPEMFTTGFSMNPLQLAEPMDGPSLQWMKRIAAEKKIVLTGSLIIEEGGEYFNRLIWMLPNGVYGVYDKRHLFAYGGEGEQFSPGSKRLIASVKGWKINLNICYDLRFPVWARQQVHHASQPGEPRPEYDLLIYVANWPERRNLAWKTLLQARAIENQCFVAGVNRVGKDGKDNYYSGDTSIIDPMGEILYTKAHEEDIFTITLQKETVDEVRTKLPFWRDADFFTILP
ncbi:MAG: nitrilase family protein [Bacteroidetes bacterium]|nr:nitrilase family protein [Bacteroidota bacterium]